MPTYLPGDVLIGGRYGYAEHIREDATFVEHVHTVDTLGNDCEVWGATFDAKGNAYMALNPIGEVGNDNNPHDVVWMPDDTGILTIVCVSDGVAELRKFDPVSGALLDTWAGLDVDPTWVHQPLKVDILCDSKTVYYTDQGQTVFRYDLNLRAQLTPFLTATPPGDFDFCAFKCYRDGSIVVALTNVGNGPRNAIALASLSELWTDEINPPGLYHVFKRTKLDGTDTLTHIVSLDPSDVNDEVIALGCYFNKCGGMPIMVCLIG